MTGPPSASPPSPRVGHGQTARIASSAAHPVTSVGAGGLGWLFPRPGPVLCGTKRYCFCRRHEGKGSAPYGGRGPAAGGFGTRFRRVAEPGPGRDRIHALEDVHVHGPAVQVSPDARSATPWGRHDDGHSGARVARRRLFGQCGSLSRFVSLYCMSAPARTTPGIRVAPEKLACQSLANAAPPGPRDGP